MDNDRQTDRLHVCIEYREFLGAEQLADVLGTLDRIYSNLYAAGSGAPLPLPPEARLRVQDSRTGNSIDLHFVDGIGQIWQQFPTIEVGVSLGVVTLMSRLIRGMGRSLKGIRSIWEEGDSAQREPAQPGHAQERPPRHPEPTSRASEEVTTRIRVIQIDVQTRRSVEYDVFNLISRFESDENYVRVEIDGTTIVDKRPAARS